MKPSTRLPWLRRLVKGLGILILLSLLVYGGWWLFQQYGSTKSERIAYLQEDEDSTVGLWLMHKDGGEPILLFSGADQIEYPIEAATGRRSPFSPQGGTLLIQARQGAGEKLVCIDLDDGHTIILVDDAPAVSGQFAPRDRRILIQEQDMAGRNSLYMLEGCNPDQRTNLFHDSESVGGYFAPDGQLVIWQANQGKTSYFLTDRRAQNLTPLASSNTVAGLSLSDDSSRMLGWTGDGDLFLTDLQTETQMVLRDDVNVQAAGFLDDEARIWSQYQQSGKVHLSLLPISGDMEHPLIIGADEIRVIELPGTSQLAFGARAGSTWDFYLVGLDSQSFELMLTGIENPIWQIASKSRRIAIGGQEWRNTKLLVYDFGHNNIQSHLPLTNAIGWLDFSDDGQLITYDVLEGEERHTYLLDVESGEQEMHVAGGYQPALE